MVFQLQVLQELQEFEDFLQFFKIIREILYNTHVQLPVPAAAQSKAWVWGRSPAEIVGSNPTGSMDASIGLITCPEESYRMWCESLCVI